MSPEQIYRAIQRRAREDGKTSGRQVSSEEYFTRHALESFLERISRTKHANDFVLKGGLLLGAYGVRRPTKDVDSNATSHNVSPDDLREVVRDAAALESSDGVHFHVDDMIVEVIRDEAEYPGIRLRVPVSLATWRGVVAWDVSTGDPIVPAPRKVVIDRVHGDPIHLIGYTPESTVAEKGVTILERGTASTRWRDYVDIVTLGQAGLDEEALLDAVRAVADYRGVQVRPIAAVVEGYAALSQPKWAAWVRKQGLTNLAAADLDEQMKLVAGILDPVFNAARALDSP